jgi:hypothetical protein
VTKNIAIAALLLLTGCGSFTLKDIHGVAVPLNAGVAWYTTLSAHEFGHKAALDGFGSSGTIHLTPRRDENGRFQFGLTTFDPTKLSSSELVAAKLLGPGTNFLQSVVFRTSLKTGVVPRWLQPTFGWIDVGGRLLSYYHALAGIGRVKGADLGEVDIWIPVSFLVLNISYDILSFVLSGDTIKRYFGVLVGERYYE